MSSYTNRADGRFRNHGGCLKCFAEMGLGGSSKNVEILLIREGVIVMSSGTDRYIRFRLQGVGCKGMVRIGRLAWGNEDFVKFIFRMPYLIMTYTVLRFCLCIFSLYNIHYDYGHSFSDSRFHTTSFSSPPENFHIPF